MQVEIKKEDLDGAKAKKTNPIQLALTRQVSKISPYLTVEVSAAKIIVGSAIYPVTKPVKEFLKSFSAGEPLEPQVLDLRAKA